MHHPWRALRHLETWTLIWSLLPGDTLGITDWSTRTITLDPRQLQSERRCTIAHEVEHVRRGPLRSRDPVHVAREESRVHRTVARQLINLDRLGDALSWSLDPHEVAEALWVDVDTLRTRIDHLHPSERAHLRRRTEHHHDHK